jgi:signal peptidase I
MSRRHTNASAGTFTTQDLVARTMTKPTIESSDKPASKDRSFLHRLAREWIAPVGIVIAIMTPIRSVIADWNDVPSGSMRPTILEGDRIYVNKLAFGLRVPFSTAWIARWDEPKRGDIVTFASPADGTRLVKRVIGLPGDHIRMDGNRLCVNGSQASYAITDEHATMLLPNNGPRIDAVLAEEHLPERDHAITVIPAMPSPKSTFREIIVPEGCYFMLGDNRDLSADSRYIGFVPRENIYGRAGFVAMSLDPTEGYAPRWDRWFSEMK